MALALCVGFAACTNGKEPEGKESQVSEEQTKTSTETGSADLQGGNQGTEQKQVGPMVALLQDFTFGTYYALDGNGNLVAEYHWDEVSKKLKDAGQPDLTYASIYAAGDGMLFTYRYEVENDVWNYYAYAIDPEKNQVVKLLCADEGWWFDGMDYYDGKVYLTAVTDGYLRKEYVFAKDPNSFSFTQEAGKYDSVIKDMDGFYVTCYSANLGRTYGNCSLTRTLDEVGYVFGESDGRYFLLKKDGYDQKINAELSRYLSVVGYDQKAILYFTEDENGLYGLYCLNPQTSETVAIYPDNDRNTYLGYADGKVYYSEYSEGYVCRTNKVLSVDVETKKSTLLYEKSTVPGATEITPGTYLFRMVGKDIYFVDLIGDKVEWVRAKLDGDSVRMENTGMVVGEKTAFRYGTIIYEEYEYKCPNCGIMLEEYYGEAFQLDASYSKMADKINKTLKDDLTSTIKNYKEYEGKIEVNDEICKEHLEMPSIYCESLDDDVSGVRIINDRYLAVDCSGYWYGGGAHGMPFTSQYLFDLTTGERMYLKDFYPGTEKDFKNLAANKTREDFLSYGDDEYGTPYFAQDARSVFNEAYEDASIEGSHVEFSEKGIYLIYDPYQMGPYASGFIQIFISYEELLGRPNL